MKLYLRDKLAAGRILLYGDDLLELADVRFSKNQFLGTIGSVAVNCVMGKNAAKWIKSCPLRGIANFSDVDNTFSVSVEPLLIQITKNHASTEARLDVLPQYEQEFSFGKRLASGRDSRNCRLTLKFPSILNLLKVWVGAPLIIGEGAFSGENRSLLLCVILWHFYIDPIRRGSG